MRIGIDIDDTMTDIKELQKNSFYKFLEIIMIQINLLFI